jgi:hypothetical protein
MIMNNDDITNAILNTKSNNKFIIILKEFIKTYKDKSTIKQIIFTTQYMI